MKNPDFFKNIRKDELKELPSLFQAKFLHKIYQISQIKIMPVYWRWIKSKIPKILDKLFGQQNARG